MLPRRCRTRSKRTPLHAAHRALGARLVPFSGWEMPVQYAGVIDEVRAVREDAGLFDVSHMGQVFVGGAGAHAYLQAVLSNDLDRIGPLRGAVHAAAQRGRRHRRRPDRLPAARRRLPAGGQRRQHRGGRRAPRGAAPGRRDARRPLRPARHGRAAGPEGARPAGGCERARRRRGRGRRHRRDGAVHLGPRARGRGRVHGRAHGLHGRAGRRADLRRRRHRDASGTR